MWKISILSILIGTLQLARAQQPNPGQKPPEPPTGLPYAIVIKGGHVIDPKNNINEVEDIAINEGRIIQIAKNIDAKQAGQAVDARGLFVVPGLIDIHGHVFYGMEADHGYSNGREAVIPDGFTFRSGITTIVDAGSSGW